MTGHTWTSPCTFTLIFLELPLVSALNLCVKRSRFVIVDDDDKQSGKYPLTFQHEKLLPDFLSSQRHVIQGFKGLH